MTGSGRKPDSYDAHMALQQRFVRRENTYWLLLILLKRQAMKRGDTATVGLINSVLQRANSGDEVKMWIMAMMGEDRWHTTGNGYRRRCGQCGAN